MEIQIKYLSRSIPNGIARFFLNNYGDLEKNPISEVREVVKTEFLNAFNDIKDIFNSFDPIDRIRIEVRDDIGRKRPSILGSFDIEKTKLYECYCFTISSHLIIESLCRRLKLQLEYNYPDQSVVWYHELVHMADWTNLEQYNILFLQGKKNRKRMEYNAFEINPDYYSPREWQFLNALCYFRNEGLAVLMEVLSGKSKQRIKSLHQAIVLFQTELEPIILFLIRHKNSYLTENEMVLYNESIERFRLLAYNLGPWFMFVVIKSKLDKELSMKMHDVMNGQSNQLSMNLITLILNKGLSLDIGSCLRLQISAQTDETFFPSTDFIFDVFNFITNEDSEFGEYHGFISSIYEANINQDIELYIESLKDLIGFPMQLSEINNFFEMVPELVSTQQNSERAYKLATKIYHVWKSTKSDLLNWALTYYIDPEDLVNDKSPFVGYLDDILVLEVGWALFKKK